MVDHPPAPAAPEVRPATSARGGPHAAGSLDDLLASRRSPALMLRDSPSRPFAFDYPAVHSTWQEEQASWTRTAVLFDQSHHMTDVYFRGPDVLRLLTDTGTNSFATFRRDRAKHFVACAPDGHMIGSAVLFGLEDDEVSLVGPAATANWVQYQAETGGYDVEVSRDERTADQPTGGRRRLFRYEIEGPAARAILEQAHGGPIEPVPFFRMTRFTLAGRPVRALSHTMAGLPGAESMGMEVWGPADDEAACLDALLAAGQDHGLVRGGALAYYTGGIESGYAAQPVPAVYSGEAMRPYRRWLPGDGYEARLSVGGSYEPDDVADYYVTPFDFGYGHLVRFDHDFIGRSALERADAPPRRRKVWLRWDDDDVTGTYASSLFAGPSRAKHLHTPLGRLARVQTDAVLVGDRLVGLSTLCAYTVNAGAWMSVAFLDPEHAVDGTRVAITWGESGGGSAKLGIEQHVQTTIRATVSTRSLAAP